MHGCALGFIDKEVTSTIVGHGRSVGLTCNGAVLEKRCRYNDMF
jgi:hypothetical protein